jgi:ribosomal protein S18 acetylase RimI-like enzyme
MIEIFELKQATQQIVDELVTLGRALHEDERTMTLQELEDLIADQTAVVIVAQDGGYIIGMATLYFFQKIGSRTSLLEDVIVDSRYRGQGLGEKLVQAIIEVARSRKVKTISLTSRPVRVAAHKLYEKLGFKIKETTVFKITL